MQTSSLVVIVNYRTGGLVVECLRSLEAEVSAVTAQVGPVQVVVVDNASGDDSPERIEQAIVSNGWGQWAQLRRLPRNGGFAWGNNAAIRPALESAAPPSFIWLLNPDTVIRPAALTSLLQFMASRPDVGIAGSRLEEPDGTVQRSAFRFPSVAGEVESGLRLRFMSRLLSRRMVAPEPPAAPAETDWLSGASLFVRREVFQAIGLMDDAFFMYFEEVDFCRRARRAGWPCWYVPDSRVVHLVGQASGIAVSNKRRPRYWFDSRRRYLLKHLGRGRTLLADALWLTGFATWRLRRALQRKPDEDPAHMLGDFARNSVFARGFRLDA